MKKYIFIVSFLLLSSPVFAGLENNDDDFNNGNNEDIIIDDDRDEDVPDDIVIEDGDGIARNVFREIGDSGVYEVTNTPNGNTINDKNGNGKDLPNTGDSSMTMVIVYTILGFIYLIIFKFFRKNKKRI